MFATPLTDLLGIEHPILLAPMAAISGARLAKAVSEAGGLGLLGGGYCRPDWVARELDDCDRIGGARVGIGFITWALAERPEVLDMALEHDLAAVMLSFGDPAPFIGTIKDRGLPVICQVQGVGEARAAARAGADIIVAQGQEAGGHGLDRRSTMALVPAVADAVSPLPVAAAGGIADGRGLAAALALGAGGVLVGTRFYAAEEAVGPHTLKERLTAACGDETVRNTVIDMVRGPAWPEGYTGRSLGNAFTDRWHGREAALAERVEEESRRYREADAAEDYDYKVVWAGEGVDMIADIVPAGEIVRLMVEGAAGALGAVSGSVRGE